MYLNEITNTFVPGSELMISHYMLTQFMLYANEQINDENMRHCYICNSFEVCGSNPYVKENSKKLEYLESLSLTSACKALIDTHMVETLELEIKE
jgi:hypothetical protein